jgi:hypothetical protein
LTQALAPPLVAPDPATFDDLTDAKRHALDDLERAGEVENGYSFEQSTRPQTIGYGLMILRMPAPRRQRSRAGVRHRPGSR